MSSGINKELIVENNKQRVIVTVSTQRCGLARYTEDPREEETRQQLVADRLKQSEMLCMFEFAKAKAQRR